MAAIASNSAISSAEIASSSAKITFSSPSAADARLPVEPGSCNGSWPGCAVVGVPGIGVGAMVTTTGTVAVRLWVHRPSSARGTCIGTCPVNLSISSMGASGRVPSGLGVLCAANLVRVSVMVRVIVRVRRGRRAGWATHGVHGGPRVDFARDEPKVSPRRALGERHRLVWRAVRDPEELVGLGEGEGDGSRSRQIRRSSLARTRVAVRAKVALGR